MSTGLSSSPLCLAIPVVLYLITVVTSSPIERSTTVLPCIPECNSTSVCEDGMCILNTSIASCETDCSATDKTEVCGSDSRTYASKCELEKQNCLNNVNISVKHTGKCHSCIKQKQEYTEWEQQSSNYYLDIIRLVDQCDDHPESFKKATDIVPFNPKCSEQNPDDYALYQVNKYCNTYWCSTPEGNIIEGTYQESESPNCDKIIAGLKSCKYDKVEYNDGEDIEGVCTCRNGTIVCKRNYGYVAGEWPEDALLQLRSDIIQMFYRQHNYAMTYEPGKHAKILLTYIVDNEADISVEKMNEILEWKFAFYDKNNNGILENIETKSVITEVYELIKVKTFEDQLEKKIDTNNDGKFSKQEWMSYFMEKNSTVISQEQQQITNTQSRRSIKKLLRTRKNFH